MRKSFVGVMVFCFVLSVLITNAEGDISEMNLKKNSDPKSFLLAQNTTSSKQTPDLEFLKLKVREQKRKLYTELQKNKPALIKMRLKQRIEKASSKNPLTPILMPLIIQRLEEKSLTPDTMLSQASKNKKAAIKKQAVVKKQLNMMTASYKTLSPAFKNKYFHPRYAHLRPGQRIESLQLGKDILLAVRPNYINEMRQVLRQAFPPDAPKFQWKPSGTTPAGAKIKPNIIKSPVKIEHPKLNLRNIKHLVRTLNKNPKRITKGQIERAPQGANFSVKAVKKGFLHEALSESLHLPPDMVPNFNGYHSVRNHYKYDVELSWFYCKNQDEYVDDEPYWHISTSILRFDPEDMDFVYWLQAGELYNTSSKVTGNYKIDQGEEKGFRQGDRSVISHNTYNANTTFTIGLWENDFSKGETKQGLEKQIQKIRGELIKEIEKAVLDALGAAIAQGLIELFPEVGGLIQSFFSGSIEFGGLMDAVQLAYGGIDMGWLVLELIFSGKDIASILEGIGGACWQCTVAILAIKYVGPVILDLLQGNFEDALKGFLMIPYYLVKSIIDFFKDIVGFFENLLKLIDPDDYIDTVSVTINGSHDDIFDDFDWYANREDYANIEVNDAPRFYREHGYGPTPQNSDLVKNNLYYIPHLSFQNGTTYRELCDSIGVSEQKCRQGYPHVDLDELFDVTVDYSAYYNVKRTLVGGRESFGYTVTRESDGCIQKRTYRTKSNRRRKIKIMVLALNSDECVPIVTVKNVTRSNVIISNLYSEDIREFYIEGYPGEEYSIQIWTGVYPESLYGYVTLEEKQAPADLKSIESVNYPNHYMNNYNNDLGYLFEITENMDKKDITFRIVPGLAKYKRDYISIESIKKPGWFFVPTYLGSQMGFCLLMKKIDTNVTEDDDRNKELRKQATFKKIGGLARGGVSFESYMYPSRYIRHRNFRLYVESGRGDLFKKDATFVIRKGKWPEIP